MGKTKQEILDRQAPYEVMNDVGVYDGRIDPIYDSMDIYAAQQSKAFMEWVVKNGWTPILRDPIKFFRVGDEPMEATLDELYQLFIKENTSNEKR